MKSRKVLISFDKRLQDFILFQNFTHIGSCGSYACYGYPHSTSLQSHLICFTHRIGISRDTRTSLDRHRPISLEVCSTNSNCRVEVTIRSEYANLSSIISSGNGFILRYQTHCGFNRSSGKCRCMKCRSEYRYRFLLFVSFPDNAILGMYYGTVLMEKWSLDTTSFFTYRLHHFELFIEHMEELFRLLWIRDKLKELFSHIGDIPFPHRTRDWIHRHFIRCDTEMLFWSQRDEIILSPITE